MDQQKEQAAATLTEILFSKIAHRFFEKYTDYEMQTDFLKTEILKMYYFFLEEINENRTGKK